MGKRSSNLTGLSRYVLDALKQSQANTRDTSENEAAICDNTTVHADSTPKQHNDGQRPSKRRRTEPPITKRSKYDATGLVPRYRNALQVPDHLQKYFSQRKRYFSLYDEGCLLDEEGWYSVTPERVADQIAERCRCDTILDAFCGVGGNAIAFAKTCERVIALDTNPTRLALARHNAVLYGVADRIEFVLTDYLSFAQSYLSLPSQSMRKIDVVFLSPPWGGPSYLSGSTVEAGETVAQVAIDDDVIPIDAHPEYSLANIQPIHGAKLFELSRRISRNVAFFLPRNSKLEEICALLQDEQPKDVTAGKKGGFDGTESEVVEVEEEWMGSKLKALTCYFGGLVVGQEHLF